MHKHTRISKRIPSDNERSTSEGWEQNLPTYELGSKAATRNSYGAVINAIAESVPSFFGGSADLAGSNKTYMNNEKDFTRDDYSGKTFGTVYVSSQWVQQ